jgi:hypothetical protein
MLLSLPWKEGRPPMPEYLTPEEVELWARGGSVIAGDTLRAYAQVVEAVAQCSLIKDDLSVDTIILARKLRGYADQG